MKEAGCEDVRQVVHIFITTLNIKLASECFRHYKPLCGPGSSVGITTGYGLDGLGIESNEER
jgi:hypothetical protein